jgi:hypothetical protein
VVAATTGKLNSSYYAIKIEHNKFSGTDTIAAKDTRFCYH